MILESFYLRIRYASRIYDEADFIYHSMSMHTYDEETLESTD